MKTAKIFWILGSLLINVTIGIYIYLMGKAPTEIEARYAYMNEHWDIFSMHWKLEFVIVTLLTIAALYFAIYFKKVSWTVITVGQLIVLPLYPIMLGGYHNTPLELAEMANNMAVIVFVFGNVLFLLGLFLLYLRDGLLPNWMRYVALALSAIAGITFLATFMDFLEWKQAMVIGPLVNLLYLINAYYGFKLKAEPS